MIPSSIIKLDKLPLNQNGKVDRRRLPAPEVADAGRAGRLLAPQSATEIALHELWSTVMGRQQIGVTDDFFDIGGHSLKASKLVSLIDQKLGISISLVTIFEAPTIRPVGTGAAGSWRNSAIHGRPGDDTAQQLPRRYQNFRFSARHRRRCWLSATGGTAQTLCGLWLQLYRRRQPARNLR